MDIELPVVIERQPDYTIAPTSPMPSIPLRGRHLLPGD
jgi:hypothetical protein